MTRSKLDSGLALRPLLPASAELSSTAISALSGFQKGLKPSTGLDMALLLLASAGGGWR